jgi:hypothetical protein
MDRSDSVIRAKLNLIRLSEAYKRCFCDPETGELTKDGERVLRDLSHFGHVHKSPLMRSPVSQTVDTHASMVAIGRAEVVRRVWAYVKLDPYAHPMMTRKEDE